VNILLIIRWPVGGIQTYCRYVYSLPLFDDCRFTVVTTTEADEAYFKSAFGSKLGELIRLEEKAFTGAGILRLARRGPRPQLIHAHGFSSGILAIPTKLWLGIPLILTSHDILQDVQFSGAAGLLKKLALGTALTFSNCINVVGNDAAQNLRSYFPRVCSDKKLSIILNGIDVERFSEAPRRDLRGELSLPDGTLLMGFFGRFMTQKGFKYILDMLDQRQQLAGPVHVVCFGWGGFIREEQAEINRRGLTSWFSFMPATNDMPQVLKGVDVVLMPSLWEAMPLLPMEAFVAGAPLIATSCIGLKEVCVGTPAIVCAPGDSQSLLEGVNTFFRERSMREARAEQYRSEAVRRFDRKQTAQSLRDLYDNMVSPNSGLQCKTG
jgi:glycosyltransferase involved in cell wall biosynthesis